MKITLMEFLCLFTAGIITSTMISSQISKHAKVALVIWLICAILAQGILTAHFAATWQEYGFSSFYNEKNFLQDKGVGLLIGLIGGPVSLFFGFFLSGFAADGMVFFWQSYEEYIKELK